MIWSSLAFKSSLPKLIISTASFCSALIYWLCNSCRPDSIRLTEDLNSWIKIFSNFELCSSCLNWLSSRAFFSWRRVLIWAICALRLLSKYTKAFSNTQASLLFGSLYASACENSSCKIWWLKSSSSGKRWLKFCTFCNTNHKYSSAINDNTSTNGKCCQNHCWRMVCRSRVRLL